MYFYPNNVNYSVHVINQETTDTSQTYTCKIRGLFKSIFLPKKRNTLIFTERISTLYFQQKDVFKLNDSCNESTLSRPMPEISMKRFKLLVIEFNKFSEELKEWAPFY